MAADENFDIGRGSGCDNSSHESGQAKTNAAGVEGCCPRCNISIFEMVFGDAKVFDENG